MGQSGITNENSSKKNRQQTDDDEENEEFKGGNTEEEEEGDDEEEAEDEEESEGSVEEEEENAPENEDVDEVAGTKSGKISVKSGGTRVATEQKPLLAQMPGSQAYHLGIQNINENRMDIQQDHLDIPKPQSRTKSLEDSAKTSSRRGFKHNYEKTQKDTHKIKTNPKYRCLDQGSDDGAEDHLKAEDFEQLSSKEIDFRETVIKFESKL